MTNSRKRAGNPATLNRISRWQSALLLLMLLTLLLQAIPSFYGDMPALGVHAKRDQLVSLAEVEQLLEQQQLPATSLTQNDEQLVLTFADIEAQQQAKKLLTQTLADQAEITVQYQSAAPAWFSKIGAEPVKLGLDLRGGVQLLLYVDLDAVYGKYTDAMVNELRSEFRKQRLRGVTVRALSSTQLALSGQPQQRQALLDSVLAKYPNQWQQQQQDGRTLLSLSETELLAQTQSAMTQNIAILRNRIGELGIVEASVQRQGREHIRIELPGVHDPKQAKSVIGATASLAFYEASSSGSMVLQDRYGNPVRMMRQPVLSGDHIVDARSSMGEMGQPQVEVRLDGIGAEQMLDFSRQHIGQPMATVYTEYQLGANDQLRPQDSVINVATINSALANAFVITGLDSAAEAQELALLLRSGALTAPIQIVEERAIGPTLGAQNIEAGISALALGMAGMALFMMLWYRRFGWVAIVALAANLVMQIGLLVLLPGAVLTLPGIAGLVLTVGMAVDTNVLIFERIRDRLRQGASLAVAIDFGYRSAFTTIFDANITTLISALCLYGIGSGPLQGFATTLILGLLSSMICGIWGTRAIINPLWGRDSRRALKI
ncbi:protein translocase subunit SecD [Ferrimonas senticii]|uniref:protein translocase subunit SecD n=1 Tax=Ferrimonas senticii TaxID=394566 RepID=UPI00040EC342|nr:protein translocase subunit SecD [Ferrimonas senticii]